MNVIETRKIMLLGEIGVGKTSIARRLSFDTFEDTYRATLGSDLYVYDVEPPPGANPFKFVVWDTDGSFGEAIFKHVYVKEAVAAIVIGDVTRQASLETMWKLTQAFEEKLPGRYLGLVINKMDLMPADANPPIPAQMSQSGLPLMQTSAKTGLNVKQTFHDAAAAIVRRGF